MKTAICETKNPVAVPLLRSEGLCAQGRSIVRHASFLRGMALAVALGPVFALPMPSFASNQADTTVAAAGSYTIASTTATSAGTVTTTSTITVTGNTASNSTNTTLDRTATANPTTTNTSVTTTSGSISGRSVGQESVGVYAYRGGYGRGDLSITNNANISDSDYGIRSAHHGGHGRHDVINNGKIINARLDGIHATSLTPPGRFGGCLCVRAGFFSVHSSEEISANNRGIYASHAGNRELRVSTNSLIRAAIGIRAMHTAGGNLRVRVEDSGEIVSSGRGIFAQHNYHGHIYVDVLSGGSVTSSGQGAIFARHNGPNRVIINIHEGGSVSAVGDTIHVPLGRTVIDVAGSVSASGDDGKAINVANLARLTLLPSFSLDGKVDGGETLRLSSSASDEGTLDFSTVEFGDFRSFEKTGDGFWTVTGVSNENEDGGFWDAAVKEGALHFSGATFKMRPNAYSSFAVEAGANLQIIGTNKLIGGLWNANDGKVIFASAGQKDELTVARGYSSSGGELVFRIDLDERGENLVWDEDKLTIEGDISTRTSQPVLVEALRTGSGPADNSPVLIEVHGVSNPDSFVGTKTFGMHSYTLTPSNRTGGGREWHFVRGPAMYTSPVRRIAPTLSRLMLPERTPVPAVPEPGGGSSAGEQSGLGLRGDARGYAGGLWAEQRSSRTSPEYDAATGSLSRLEDNRVRFGFNAPATNLMGGDMVVGASMSQGLSASEVSSPVGDGSIGIESHAAALTALWRSPGGFYADGQARYARFSSSVSAENLFLVRDNEGVGTSVSAELGYGFAVPLGGMDFEVAPQAQLVWSHVDFDDFIGLHGGLFSLEDGDLVTGRLGLSWDGEWQDAGGSGRIYGGMNLHDSVDGRTSVNVSGESFVSKQGLSVDGKLGLSYEWDGGYAVYGEATAVRRDGAEEVRANLGMSIDF